MIVDVFTTMFVSIHSHVPYDTIYESLFALAYFVVSLLLALLLYLIFSVTESYASDLIIGK